MQRGDRRNSMLKFVQDVQPIIVEQFAEHTPAQVKPCTEARGLRKKFSNAHCTSARHRCCMASSEERLHLHGVKRVSSTQLGRLFKTLCKYQGRWDKMVPAMTAPLIAL